MITSLYIPGKGVLQRLSPGWKLGVLMVAGAVLFALHNLWGLGAIGVLACLLVWCTGVGAATAWRQLRGLSGMLLVIGLATLLFQGWQEALALVLRVGALVGLALAVTLSTRTSDLIAVCERALMPLQRLGLLNAAKVTLALALALRFVPEIWRNYQDIRQAQAARGRVHELVLGALGLGRLGSVVLAEAHCG
jgi:biotin transport system permease protein